MIDPIQKLYEKLTDDLQIIGYNTILRFSVTLARKQKDGTRFHYHQEYKYTTNKYIDTNKVITLRRSFDYFLSIENIRANENGIKEFIMIRIQDIKHVIYKLNQVAQWFMSDKYKNLFVLDNNRLRILKGNEPDPIVIEKLAQDKFLILKPVVISFENNDMPGVRMYLSSKDNYTDITIDNFMGMLYLIENINMYESAALLLNYIQRPELGSAIKEFNSYNDIPEQPEDGIVETKIHRKVGGNKIQKSFFDKMDEM